MPSTTNRNSGPKCRSCGQHIASAGCYPCCAAKGNAVRRQGPNDHLQWAIFTVVVTMLLFTSSMFIGATMMIECPPVDESTFSAMKATPASADCPPSSVEFLIPITRYIGLGLILLSAFQFFRHNRLK